MAHTLWVWHSPGNRLRVHWPARYPVFWCLDRWKRDRPGRSRSGPICHLDTSQLTEASHSGCLRNTLPLCAVFWRAPGGSAPWSRGCATDCQEESVAFPAVWNTVEMYCKIVMESKYMNKSLWKSVNQINISSKPLGSGPKWDINQDTWDKWHTIVYIFRFPNKLHWLNV